MHLRRVLPLLLGMFALGFPAHAETTSLVGTRVVGPSNCIPFGG